MARNRGLALRPVDTEKIEQTWSNLAQDAGSAKIEISIITAVRNVTTANQVKIGASIKWIYFEFHFSAQTTTNPKVMHWLIQKVPQGVSAMEADPIIYNQTNKKYIIKRGMEMLPSDTSTVFKRIFSVRIPRWMQRTADGDIWKFIYHASSTETINACGIAITRRYN